MYTNSTVEWRYSQLLLSNGLLLRFKSKKEFILEIYEVWHLQEKRFFSWKVKLFCVSVYSSTNVCSTRCCEMKFVGELLDSSLNKSNHSHFLEEIFRPADSKSFRMKSGKCQMQLNHGVWDSPFKRTPTVCVKRVSSLLRESA